MSVRFHAEHILTGPGYRGLLKSIEDLPLVESLYNVDLKPVNIIDLKKMILA